MPVGFPAPVRDECREVADTEAEEPPKPTAEIDALCTSGATVAVCDCGAWVPVLGPGAASDNEADRSIVVGPVVVLEVGTAALASLSTASRAESN